MMAAMMGAIAFQKGLGVTHSLAHPLTTDRGRSIPWPRQRLSCCCCAPWSSTAERCGGAAGGYRPGAGP